MCNSRWILIAALGALPLGPLAAACSSAGDGLGLGKDANGGASGLGGVGGGSSGVDGSDGESGGGGGSDIEGGSGGESCGLGPDDDSDGDGYTPNQGDCNDCNPSVNPGAFDVPGNGVDDDCNEVVDDPVECDTGFAVADDDPMHGAHAIELCRTTSLEAQGSEKTWGVISAKYVMADGTDGMAALSHGLLPSFGNAGLRAGAALLALSTGHARAADQPGYSKSSNVSMNTASSLPVGFPRSVPACPGVTTSNECRDPAALELEIRVPTNANSFSFNLNFFTGEYPTNLCTSENNIFVSLLWPTPPTVEDNNISFDEQGNTIGVNCSWMLACSPGTFPPIGGKHFDCPLGKDMLEGTVFSGISVLAGAATGWLATTSPVEPGSIIKLRFAIWESSERQTWPTVAFDSTVLIDNFQWHTESVESAVTIPLDP